jgi:outer membrane lipoprotein LolB
VIRFSSARTAFLLCALFISGCASVPRGPGVAVDPAQVQAFELNGRINVRAQQSAYPGRIRWQHEPRRDEVWLYSPLGSAVAHIEQDPSGATLATSDGKKYRGADANGLARDVLGYDLPLDALQFWVRGLPAPRLSGTERTDDAQGRPEVIQQGGWKVSYLDWAPAGADGLPSKLDVAGTGVRMRLVVDEWKVNERRP